MNDYTDRYTGLTKADFDALDLSDILASATQPTACDFARPLNLKAQELEAKNQLGPSRAAKALADICMYGFSPHSQEQVFSPFMQLGEQRTPAPEDLPPELLPVLAKVAMKSSEPELRARLGDVCCVRMAKRDRNLSHATAEAYLEAACILFSAGCFDIGVLRIYRALDVACNPDPDLVQQIQRTFDDFLTNVAPTAPLLEVVQMFELYRSRLGGDEKLLASATAPFVQKAGTQEQWELQRRLLICQADWTSKAGQQTDAENLYREAAETHIRRADECKTWITPNGFVIADHLARAVKAHRCINRKSSRADQLEIEEQEIRRKAVEAFELEALLIRRWGCNLRNDISHGRLWPSQLIDPPARYLWWLTLRFCMFGLAPLGKPWNAATAEK